MKLHCRLLTLSAALAATAATCQAAELEPWSVPFAEPLRLSSSPLDESQGEALPAGVWQVSVSTAYFNLWSGSWHTATIHSELGLVGKPLTPGELRTLEARHPNDNIYRLDLEGWMTEVRLARGLPHGLNATVTVPWVDVGRPHWDAISYDIHNSLGWGGGGRKMFPHGQTLIYVWSPRQRRALERWHELDAAGLGDLRLALGGALGHWGGGEHRWVVTAEAPTGEKGTLQGSGGWDAGVRWFGWWRFSRAALRCALGFTSLSRSGSFLGVRRADTWHALAEYHHAWGIRGAVVAAVRYDGSPLAGFSAGEPGQPAFFFTFGARRWLSERTWIGVALGENLVPQGITPDFTVHLQLGSRYSRNYAGHSRRN